VDSQVAISELTRAIGFALGGCPPAPTPTAIPVLCGDPVVVERFGRCRRSTTEAECVSLGGRWGPFPYSRRDGCFCRTGQGGCPCQSSDDCLSFCIAYPPPGQDIDSCARVETGSCSHEAPRAGCFCASLGGRFGGLCSDP
jgi:hypothetical protein